MTDKKACGVHKLDNITGINAEEFLSDFKGAAMLTQLRMGCDGKPGTVGQFDACGVCQGDDSTCTDCAGVVNGKAIMGWFSHFFYRQLDFSPEPGVANPNFWKMSIKVV